MEAFYNIQRDISVKVTKANTNLRKSPKDRLTISYIEVRLENLETQWSSFIETHRTIVSEVKEAELHSSEYYKSQLYEVTEELYFDYKTELKELLRRLLKKENCSASEGTSSSAKEEVCSVKLPTITLPTFSGEYSQWVSFRDLFTSLIHNNKSLDDVQRLHYLKSHLSGEAEQLLRNVPITSANYEVCWKQLEGRYNNKKYMASCILKRFMGQKNVSTESARALKELLDTSNDCLNALKNLNINTENWDIIVIHILSLKLDTESRKQWEIKISDSEDLPTFNIFKEFLEQRFRSLEFLDSKVVNRNVNTVKTLHVTTATAMTISCGFCSENHKLGNCKKFAKEDTDARRYFVQNSGLCFNCLGPNHSVYNCRQPTRCRICKRKHHSLLHSKDWSKSTDNNQSSQSVDQNVVVAVATSPAQDENTNIVTNCSSSMSNQVIQSTQVLLPTALVKVESRSGAEITLRSLLDQGSQASYITEAAVQLLGLRKYASKSSSLRLGDDEGPALTSKYIVYVKMQSLQDLDFVISVKAHVLKSLTTLLPTKKIVIPLWPKLAKYKLADPNWHTPSKIDLLLSAAVYSKIIREGVEKGPPGFPIGQNTKLGWIISGEISGADRDIVERHQTYFTINAEENDLLKRFWELEAEPCKKKHLTQEEKECERIFKETTKRDPSGRYIVKLPFKTADPNCKYGKSEQIALKRFLSLEKRLQTNSELKIQYSEVINEYIQLGHMEIVPPEQRRKLDAVYLPHHAVVKENKSTTKVRVVFDASCLGSNGVSLNNELMVGPTLQSDLRHIIMRWRRHPVCIIADIVKMYRQVIVSNDDVDFQRLFWRDDPESEIKHLRLLRVTFGTASAPYLAVRTLHHIAYDEGEQFPVAAEKVLEDYYMDDLMTGCQTVPEGIKIYSEMKELLMKGGFQLQKWTSNNEELLDHIKEDKKETEKLKLSTDKVMKILGLTWNRVTDEFEYTVQLPELKIPVTKRRVISHISMLFDPLGWLAPTIVMAKVFIQKIWLSGIEWDEELPAHLLKEWMTYRNELSQLNQFKMPRWTNNRNDDDNVQLHGFCDASNDAYAAVVYIRNIDIEGRIHVHLVAAKTKVAPIKQVSIPRLELCGAVLLSKLLMEVSEVLSISKSNIHAWSDSSVVLAWLSSHPSRWKTFIANRVAEILTVLDGNQWSHVRSKENPADCASRGIMPSELLSVQLWKYGPKWLQNKEIDYGKRGICKTNLEEKAKKVCYVACEEEEEVWNKFSSLRKLVRVMAYCRRFLHLKNVNKNSNKLPSWLTAKELNEALTICMQKCQKQNFRRDMESLIKTGKVERKSKLTSLNPFVDETGLMRVGGRLERANVLTDDMKHPVILPARSFLTDLIIADAHFKTLHGGPQLMVNHLRSRYWIIDVKNRTKFFVRKCVTCVRHAARFREQLMGQLPVARVTACRPFYRSGVDYAGPINIRTSKGRGHHAYKGYICLFICMATRAIHLEAVSDLTSQGFLAAFKRFVARRGHCSDLFSDNGTNFVGAARELKQLLAEERSGIAVEIAESLATNGTTWHFIPPYSPNFGGLWEAGIKSTKHHLKRVIGNSTLTYEEMVTVLSQIEACLNSRPISQISDNPLDPSPLTPGHFLVGEPLVLVPDSNFENSNITSLRRWQLTQRMTQDFWRRWSKEYLSQFMHRYKWSYQTQEPNLGDIVLVKEDDLPPARWLFGIVVEKHPGMDKITRVVSLRCKGAVIKRPVTKLCILPVTK